MTKQEQVYDSPGVPGAHVRRCPTCDEVVRCRVCGFVEAACRAYVANATLAPHEYQDGLGVRPLA